MNSKFKSHLLSCIILLCISTLFTQCVFTSTDEEFVSIEQSTPKDLQILIDESDSETQYIFTDVQKSSIGYGIWAHTVFHTLEAQEKEAQESGLNKLPASQSVFYVVNLDRNEVAPKSSIWYNEDGEQITTAEVYNSDLEWNKIIPGTLGALYAKCIKEIRDNTFEYELD